MLIYKDFLNFYYSIPYKDPTSKGITPLTIFKFLAIVFLAVTATIGQGACNLDKLNAVSPVVNNNINLTFKLNI